MSGDISDLPSRIRDYALMRPIGGGGYGEVWLARNAIGGWCAVKVVHRRTFEDDRPYEREFAGIQKFEPVSRSHPHLVNVLHVGRDDAAGFFYYVMELADDATTGRAWSGEHPAAYQAHTLKHDLRARRLLPVAGCVEIGRALAGALRHLHERGLVHRDVKPSNVIYLGGVPKLADIGLVAATGEARSFVGTEGFIPPEGPGAPQADLYGLGKLLYEISTGKDRNEYPEPITRLGELSDHEARLELNVVIHRACQPNLKARYASAAAMENDLAALQAGKSVRARHRWRRTAQRSIVAMAAILIFTAIGFGASRWRGNSEKPAVISAESIRLVEEAEALSPTTREGFEKTLELCHRALELSPNHAKALVVLANAYREAAGWHRPERQAMIEAKQAALRAVRLDEHNAGAHIQLGLIQMLHDWDFAAAEASFTQGLALKRDDAWHLTAAAELFRSRGRLAESRALVEEAGRLGGSGQTFGSVNHLTDLALQLYAERNFAEMLKQCAMVRSRKPQLILPHIYDCLAYAGLQRYDEALKSVNLARAQEDAPDLMALAAYCHARRGQRDDALALLKRLDDFAPVMEVSPYYRAYVFAGLNDADAVFAQLNLALEQRSGHLVGYSWRGLLKDAIWLPFHADPRWKELVAKVGLR